MTISEKIKASIELMDDYFEIHPGATYHGDHPLVKAHAKLVDTYNWLQEIKEVTDPTFQLEMVREYL